MLISVKSTLISDITDQIDHYYFYFFLVNHVWKFFRLTASQSTWIHFRIDWSSSRCMNSIQLLRQISLKRFSKCLQEYNKESIRTSDQWQSTNATCTTFLKTWRLNLNIKTRLFTSIDWRAWRNKTHSLNWEWV